MIEQGWAIDQFWVDGSYFRKSTR